MDPSEIERLVLQRFEEAGISHNNPITREELVVGMWLSRRGQRTIDPAEYSDRSHYEYDPLQSPWADELRALHPRHDHPRVLVFGRRGSSAEMREMGTIRNVCCYFGVQDAKIVFSNSVETLWPNFFGSRDFYSNPLDVPVLVISRGYSKIVEASGNTQVDVTDLLDNIEEAWGIPCVIVRTEYRRYSKPD